jgi:hypothetical protein
MCLACEMDGLWFAAMEARASAAIAAEALPQATLPPLPEGGRVGEGVASGVHGPRGEWAGPLPDPGGGGSPPAERLDLNTKPPPRFSCEETPAG